MYIIHLFSFYYLYNKLKFDFKRYVGREDHLDLTHSSLPHFILSSSNNPELISYTQSYRKKELGKITFPSAKMDYTKKAAQQVSVASLLSLCGEKGAK